MERSLIERSIALHGTALGKLVAEEQGEEDLETDAADMAEHSAPEGFASKNPPPQKQSHLSDKKNSVKRPTFQMGTSQPESYKIQQFIAKKADMLFKKRGDPPKGTGTQIVMQPSEQADYYAILPPLEQHMAVPPDASRARLFQLLHVGDVVVGRIVSRKEFGLFVQLVSLCQDLTRYVEVSEVIALLPATELSDRFSKAVKVDDFEVGEYIRGVVTKVNVDEQKVIMTLKAPSNMDQAIILGMISESELPIHYRRSLALAESLESHEQMLTNTLGFDNPNNVAYLTNLLGIDEKKPPSLMRSLQSVHFTENESAESLRKWQSGKLAMASVAKGVDHFKAGRHLEAMQHLNKALEIDTENVEALVARGALYANTGSLSKALHDFGAALQINPNHRNANKYMCQTLLERGKELEDSRKYLKARECYQSALDIQPEWLDAQLCLQKLNERKPPVQSQTPSKFSANAPSQMSAKALLKMVDQDDLSDKDESKKSNKRRKSHEKKETYTVRSRWCSSSRSRSRERSQEPNTSPLQEQISKRQGNVIEEKGKDGKRKLSKELEIDNQQKSMTSRESISETKGKNRSPRLARSPDRNQPGTSKINNQERSKSQKRKSESRWSKSGSRTPSPSRSANKQKLRKKRLDSDAKSRSPEKQSKSRRNKSESRTPSPSRSSGERNSRKSRHDSHERSRSLKRQSKIRRDKSESRTPSPSRSSGERNSRKSRHDSHERSRSLKRQSKSRRNKSESRTPSPSRSPSERNSRKPRCDSHERSRSLKSQSESRRNKSESRTPSPSRSPGERNSRKPRRDSHERSRSLKSQSENRRNKSESRTPSPSRSPGKPNFRKSRRDSHEKSQSLKSQPESRRNKSESRTSSPSRSPGGWSSRKTRHDSHERSRPLKRQSESRRNKSETRTLSPSRSANRKKHKSCDSKDRSRSPKIKKKGKKSESTTPSPTRSPSVQSSSKMILDSQESSQLLKRKSERKRNKSERIRSLSRSPGRRNSRNTRLDSHNRPPSLKRQLESRSNSGSRTPSPSRSSDRKNLRKASLDSHDRLQSPERKSARRREKSGSKTTSSQRSTDRKKIRKTSRNSRDKSQSPKTKFDKNNRSGSKSPSRSVSPAERKLKKARLGSSHRSQSPKIKSSKTPSPPRFTDKKKLRKTSLDVQDSSGSPKRRSKSRRDKSGSRTPSPSRSTDKKKLQKTSLDVWSNSGSPKRRSKSRRDQSGSRTPSPLKSTDKKDLQKTSLDVRNNSPKTRLTSRKDKSKSRTPSPSRSTYKKKHRKTSLDVLDNSGSPKSKIILFDKDVATQKVDKRTVKTTGSESDELEDNKDVSKKRSESKLVLKHNRHESTASELDLENSSRLSKRKSSSGRYQSRSRSRSPFDKTSVKKTNKMAKPNQTSDSDSGQQARPLKKDKGKSRKQSEEKESVLVQIKDKFAQDNDVHTRAESPVRKSEISKLKKKQYPSKSSCIEKSKKKTDVKLTTYQQSDSESCDRQDRSSKPEVKEFINFSEDQTKKHDKNKKVTDNIQSQNDATLKRSYPGKSVNELSTKKRLLKLSSSPNNYADQQLGINKTSSERMAYSRSRSRSPLKRYSKKKKVSSTSSSSSESEDISPPSKKKSKKKKKKKQSSSTSSSDSDSEKPKLKSAKKIKKKKKSENKSMLSDVKKKISTDVSEGFISGKLNPESKVNLRREIGHSVLNKQNANSIVSSYSSNADASDISMADSRPSCRRSAEDQQFATKMEANVFSLSKQFQEDRSDSHSPSQDLANDQKVVTKLSTDSSFADKPGRSKKNSMGENSTQLKISSKSANSGTPVIGISEYPHIHDEHSTTETKMNKDSEGSVSECSRKEQSVGKVLELSKEQQAMLRQKYRNFNKVKRKSAANVENLQNPTGPKPPPSPDNRQPKARTPDPADVYGISASASFMYDANMSPNSKVGLASSYEGFMDKNEKKVTELFGKDSVDKLYEKQEVIKSEDTVVPVTKVLKPSRWDRKESANTSFDVSSKCIPSKPENKGVRWGGYKNRDVYKTKYALTSNVNDHVSQSKMCKDEDTWGTRRTSSSGSSYFCGEDELRKAQESFNKEKDSTEKQCQRFEEQHMAYGAHVSKQLEYGKDKSMADETVKNSETSNKFCKSMFPKEISHRTKHFQEESYTHMTEMKHFNERHFSESTSYGLDQTSSEVHKYSGSLTNVERSGDKKHHFLEERPRSRGDSDKNSRRNYKKCDDGIHCGTDDEDEILSKNCRLTKNCMNSEKCDDDNQAPVSKSKQRKYLGSSKDKDDYKTKKECDDGIHCGTDDDNQVPIIRNRQRKDKSQLNRQSQDFTDEDVKLDNQARQAAGSHSKKYTKKCDDGIHCGTDDEDNKVPLNRHCKDKGHSDKRINNEDSKSEKRFDDGVHCGTDESLKKTNEKDSKTEKRCNDGVNCGTDDEENVSHNQEKDQLGRKMKKQTYDSATGERDVSTQRTCKLLKNQRVAIKNDETKIACEDGIHCGTDDDDESIRTTMLGKKLLISDDCKKAKEVDLKNRDIGKCADSVHCGTDDEMNLIPQSDLDKTEKTVPIVHQRLLQSNKIPNSQVEINAQSYASSKTNSHTYSPTNNLANKEGTCYQHNKKPKDHVRSNSESSSSDSSVSRSTSYSSTSSSSSSVNSHSSSESSSGSSSSSSSNSSQQSRGNKRRRKQRKSYSSSTDTSTSSSSVSQMVSGKPSHIKKTQRKKRRKRNLSVTSSTLSSTNSSTSSSKFSHSDHENKYSDKKRSGKRYSSSSSKSNISSKKLSAHKDSSNGSSNSSGEVDMSIYEVKTDSLENYLETAGHKLVSPPDNKQWRKRKSRRSSENDTSNEENARKSIKDKESKSKKTKEDRKRRTKRQMSSSRSPSPSDQGRTTKTLAKKIMDSERHVGDMSERTPLRGDDIYSHRIRNKDSYVDEQGKARQDHIHNDRHRDRYPKGSNYDSTSDRYREKNSSRYRPDNNAPDKQRDRYPDVHLRDRSYDRSQDNYTHEHRNSQNRENSRHGHRHREGPHKRRKYIPVEIKESNPFFSLLTRDKAALLEDLYKEVVRETETNEESGVKTNHGVHRVWWTSETCNDEAE